MRPTVFVRSAAELRDVCSRLAASEWVALDTEFVRDRSYFAKLCLVQLADPTCVVCVDPLEVDDLTPVHELLFEPKLTKLVHAGRQDLEIFFERTGAVPAPVFDTQVAAALLGYGDQLGYGVLVERRLGIQIDKSRARTDWTRRPLADEALSYALDDVRYLGEMHAWLSRELAELGRAAWAAAEFERLFSENQFTLDLDQAWSRVKGAQRLSGRELAILRELAAWREGVARRVDTPRRWVASDPVLIECARRAPRSHDRLAQLRGIGRPFVQEHGADVLDAVARGRDAPSIEANGDAPTAEDDARVAKLAEVVREIGDRHSISTATLACRRDLERLVRGELDVPCLRGWRAEVLGAELLRALGR